LRLLSWHYYNTTIQIPSNYLLKLKLNLFCARWLPFVKTTQYGSTILELVLYFSPVTICTSMENRSISVVDATYTIDTSKPCPHKLGTIENCGQREEGSMFPYCAVGDMERCPQVIVHFRVVSPSEIKNK
jgi:hypothetical protein